MGALEAALLAGEIDLAVHSAKDVPGELAAGTAIVATPRRAEPFDALVGDLREGARVGTSALRRRAQLLAARPDLEVVELRGNVDTRLAKRAAGEVDALVLAAAGLDRLGRRDEASALLFDGVFVPAAGQGVIAVQGRVGQRRVAAAADHAPTHAALDEERHVVRALGASCHTPVGVLAARRQRARVRRPARRLRVPRRRGRDRRRASRAGCSPPGAAELLRGDGARDRLPRRRRARAIPG